MQRVAIFIEEEIGDIHNVIDGRWHHHKTLFEPIGRGTHFDTAYGNADITGSQVRCLNPNGNSLPSLL